MVLAGAKAVVILEDGSRVDLLEGPPTQNDLSKDSPDASVNAKQVLTLRFLHSLLPGGRNGFYAAFVNSQGPPREYVKFQKVIEEKRSWLRLLRPLMA